MAKDSKQSKERHPSGHDTSDAWLRGSGSSPGQMHPNYIPGYKRGQSRSEGKGPHVAQTGRFTRSGR